ncbi:SHOCT domain-containing protein [candidate division WOR-3 bacterium]|nr:SHOCT domain-containing protein [candidate division WOR-3 bacterium]
MRWTTKKNKIMHRTIQTFIFIIGIGCIYSFIFSVLAESDGIIYRPYPLWAIEKGLHPTWREVIHQFPPEYVLECYSKGTKPSYHRKEWIRVGDYFKSVSSYYPCWYFWTFTEKQEERNARGNYGVTTGKFYKVTDFKWGRFSLVFLSMSGFFVSLIWAFRVRKLTPEEKDFRQEILKIGELLEKNLLSEDEYKTKSSDLFKKFLSKLKANKKRLFEYKIERLSSLKEEGFISEEEFKQGKAELIEELE